MKATCAKCQHIFFVPASSASRGGAYNRCPRCGTPFSTQKGTILSAERSWDTSGIHPMVHGAYAGVAGGTAGGVLAVLLTLLGFGFIFSGAQLSGGPAAMALLMSFLRMVSLGILIGLCLPWIRERNKIEVWGIIGGAIGALMGAVLGLIYEIVAGAIMTGGSSLAFIFGSTIGWATRATLVTILAIVARILVFPSRDEGSFLSTVSISQQGIIGILGCLVVLTIGVEIKYAHLGRSAQQLAMEQLSTEGLVLRDLEESVNYAGDLVVTGTLENTSKTDKTAWIAIAELFDDDGRILRRATLINGLQMVNVNDMEILRKRGRPTSPPTLSEVYSFPLFKAGSSVRLKVTFYGPPEKYKECTVVLKDAGQNSIQEILSETLKDLKPVHGKHENVIK